MCQPKNAGGMCFKDLENFNKVMLIKQVWRLVYDKSTLFYRVFKAKFFPIGSIFEAKVLTGSYTWQSILKVRLVIADGMIWRIRDGRSV